MKNFSKKIRNLFIIIPAYNEEDNVEKCYEAIMKAMQNQTELDNCYDTTTCFVDDGSKDKTRERLIELAKEHSNCKVIILEKNAGHQNAVFSGLTQFDGDVCVIMDCDLQDPPAEIPKMLKLIEQGADRVYGQRETRDGESHFKLLTAEAFYRFQSFLTDGKIPARTGDFCAMTAPMVKWLAGLTENNKYLRGLEAVYGGKQVSHKYNRDKRFSGETHYPLKKMIQLALNMVFGGFTKKPLQLISVFACLMFILMVFFMIVSCEYAGVLALMSFIGGLVFVSIRIVAEFVYRGYIDGKHRPEHVIKDVIN